MNDDDKHDKPTKPPTPNLTQMAFVVLHQRLGGATVTPQEFAKQVKAEFDDLVGGKKGASA